MKVRKRLTATSAMAPQRWRTTDSNQALIHKQQEASHLERKYRFEPIKESPCRAELRSALIWVSRSGDRDRKFLIGGNSRSMEAMTNKILNL